VPRFRESTEYAPGLNGRAVGRVTKARPWLADALCADHDVDMWFPEPGHEGRQTAVKARRICQACPVQLQCLAANIHEEHGIYGGATERQRRQIRGLVAQWGHAQVVVEILNDDEVA
jgi:WhiB family redox-sensing transcriptional regulator